MKKRTCQILLAILTLVLCLGSCSPKEDGETAKREAYDVEHLEEYISLDAYEGLTVTADTSDATKGEVIWQAIVARAEILDYPQAQVDYYAAQERAKYRYLEEEVSEDVLLAEAKRLVKEDLVYQYILKDTGMELTEEEKETLFDRYVEKYVGTYGYSEEYVKENMRDLVYDSMLYDKTMEYLILNNTVILPGETE